MSTAARPELSRLGRAAVAYAERGWHVFPLRPRAKQPLIARGFLEATSDVERVTAWWRQHPTANIGMWPGQSGFVILDLDGPEGVASAEALGVLAEPTLECATGREDGGRHLYFRRPTFSVPNRELAPKLDVRGDAGYVVVPPSIHPTGKLYAWTGRLDDVRDLPASVVTALLASPVAGARMAGGVGQRPASDIAFDEEIGAGGRNNALTRYAGRLLAKRIPADEVLVLVSALNQAKCRPALPPSEVNILVANLALKESQKRGAIAIVRDDDEAPPASSLPTALELAATQVAGAKALLTRDLSNAPNWAWDDVSAMCGPMLPGDFVVVGSLMGNGKSTLLMSQMDAFAEQKRATLYFPLEIDAEVCRLRWAAWKLVLDVRHVIRQDWSKLPEGSREAVDGVIDEQETSPFIHFATPKRVTFAELAEWCRWGKAQGCDTVMLDHLHRMDFGGDSSNHRVTVTEVVRRLKDLARELGIVLIAAAQLNRSNDPIDMYTAPQLGRLKESAGIAEEADVALMLSRFLKPNLPDKWMAKLHVGEISEADLAEPGVMAVTCRKHRLDDSALNRRVLLSVVNGKLQTRHRSWQTVDREWTR
jgi:hypothetical protein